MVNTQQRKGSINFPAPSLRGCPFSYQQFTHMINMLGCMRVTSTEVLATSVPRHLFPTHKRRPGCTNIRLGGVLLLSGPQIPRVQLYYKAEDQEQWRAAYFRKKVATLLLDISSLMLAYSLARAHSHFGVSPAQTSCCFDMCKKQRLIRVWFSLNRLKCPYDVSVELAAYCLQSRYISKFLLAV